MKKASATIAAEYIPPRTRLTTLNSKPPMKLIAQKGHHADARAWLSHFGGGMVNGDDATLTIQVGPQANLSLESQGNAHIYKQDNNQRATFRIEAHIAQDATLVWWPLPTVPHEQSRFEQTQSIALTSSSTLWYRDIVSDGRTESGEQNAFTQFASRLGVTVDDQHVFQDAISLSPENPQFGSSFDVDEFHCFATVIAHLPGEAQHALGNTLASWQANTDGRDDLWGEHYAVDDRLWVIRVAADRYLTLDQSLSALSSPYLSLSSNYTTA